MQVSLHLHQPVRKGCWRDWYVPAWLLYTQRSSYRTDIYICPLCTERTGRRTVSKCQSPKPSQYCLLGSGGMLYHVVCEIIVVCHTLEPLEVSLCHCAALVALLTPCLQCTIRLNILLTICHTLVRYDIVLGSQKCDANDTSPLYGPF